MPELHSNGIYEAYLAELFNPLAGGTQFNPTASPTASGFQFNTGAMGGIGGGLGGAGIAAGPQTPWTAYPQQAFPQQIYPQQTSPQLNAQWPQQGMQSPTHALPAVVQHLATKQAVQAIQLSQVLHALPQILQTIAAQQQHLVQTLAQVTQPQFGYGVGGGLGPNPPTQSLCQAPGFGQVPGVGVHRPVSQA